jgi:chromosome partitioning protein
LKKYFGELLFETRIRDTVALAEAPAQRKDIFDYNRKSSGAKDYLALSKEILARTEQLSIEA